MSVGGHHADRGDGPARGLPLALASPFAPVSATADMIRGYVSLVEESDLDTDLILDRAIVLLYMLIAPTKAEAHDIQKQPYEWHMRASSALARRCDRSRSGTRSPPARPPPEIPDDDWQRQIDTNLVFDDPAGCIEKIELLHDAGVRNVVCWQGVGGVAQDTRPALDAALRRGSGAAVQGMTMRVHRLHVVPHLESYPPLGDPRHRCAPRVVAARQGGRAGPRAPRLTARSPRHSAHRRTGVERRRRQRRRS